jgi:hypothetical protein
MRHDSSQLIVIGLAEQAGRDIKPSAAGASGVDFALLHDSDLNLSRLFRVIHGCKQRGHDPIETLGLFWIDPHILRLTAFLAGRWLFFHRDTSGEEKTN